MVSPVLHYIYDPYCGWCYGASALISAAAKILPLELHGGGMFSGARRTRISAEFRSYVEVYDQKIAALTGQEFGLAYRHKLLHDDSVLMDSALAIAAIQVAQQSAGLGLAMLERIQHSHYVAGLNVSDSALLQQLAQELGLDEHEFSRRFDWQRADSAHLLATRELMRVQHIQGFPNLLLQQGEQWRTLAISHYYGKPAEFSDYLQTMLTVNQGSSQKTDNNAR